MPKREPTKMRDSSWGEATSQYFNDEFEGEGGGSGTTRAFQAKRGARGPQRHVDKGTPVDLRENQKYRK